MINSSRSGAVNAPTWRSHKWSILVAILHFLQDRGYFEPFSPSASDSCSLLQDRGSLRPFSLWPLILQFNFQIVDHFERSACRPLIPAVTSKIWITSSRSPVGLDSCSYFKMWITSSRAALSALITQNALACIFLFIYINQCLNDVRPV